MRNAITQYHANTKLIPLITQIITHDYLIITHKCLFYSSLRTKIKGGVNPPPLFSCAVAEYGEFCGMSSSNNAIKFSPIRGCVMERNDEQCYLSNDE